MRRVEPVDSTVVVGDPVWCSAGSGRFFRFETGAIAEYQVDDNLLDVIEPVVAEVQVGDVVLAFDFDAGTTVSRTVTATLPHTDWLLEAHFSDGSVMSVTEDHRFWSITDTAWLELQDLDPTDVLLTPDGATVTVDWLDWHAGVTAPAWDLTVAEEHNFFVAADGFAEPVLVHNQTL